MNPEARSALDTIRSFSFRNVNLNVPEKSAIIQSAQILDEIITRYEVALADLFLMMDEEILVRNTDRDHEPDFALRTLSVVSRLKSAYEALNHAPRTKED